MQFHSGVDGTAALADDAVAQGQSWMAESKQQDEFRKLTWEARVVEAELLGCHPRVVGTYPDAWEVAHQNSGRKLSRGDAGGGCHLSREGAACVEHPLSRLHTSKDTHD